MKTFPHTAPAASLLLVVFSLALPSQAADRPTSLNSAAGEVRFNRDIRPILSSRCFKCHGPDLKKAGLDLQSRDSTVRPLKSGETAVVPGNSAASRLIQKISTADDGERMPPKGKGDRLTPDQVAKLRAWIDQGAKWEEHWAYVKPERPALPAVKRQAWVRNDIDAFILARLDQEGLSPSPEADRATLLRRASLDLIGLPPSLTEVDAFLADAAPEAYEKAIDRLLASPHYGERQARPWLDLARYADTNGYEADYRRTIWPYRDWVIDALNRDLPFDQFTVEQIAGDLLPNATVAQKIATGFNRNTMVNTEGGTDDEEFRVAAVVDRVNTTMEVWMGTTMGCAQCHNHKFDPFTQEEYYCLFAFLNSTEDRGRSTEPSLLLPTAKEVAQRKKINTASADLLGRLLAAPSLLGSITLFKVIEKPLAEVKKQEAELKPASTMVMRELPQPRPTNILLRGNHNKKGAAVAPGVPAKWHPLRKGEPNSRLALARWLADPDNPLVGRVTMNRLWAQYFGRGLVETSEDFGAQGEPPTHPELLDWLATELIRQKWSLKAMHRLIVTSATYRQSSHVTRPLYERDPYNRLLARGPRLRMEAEMVRDNALAVSGLLDRKVGGPSVFPYQPEGVWANPYSKDQWVQSTNGDQYRRGLYTFWRRTAPYAAFMAFDAPSREVACDRRPRTNTPLQALATLNDKAFIEPAAALARRMMREVKGQDEDRAVYGFRLCVSRPPRPIELAQLLALYRENLAKYRQDRPAAAALATSGLSPPPQELVVAELAAWTVIANVLLNLDETITKG
jgi:mono/diheme cytochrome c family protein